MRLQLPARSGHGQETHRQNGPLSLETVGKAKITCSSGAAVGEYTGAKTLTVTIILSGCERPSSHELLQATVIRTASDVGTRRPSLTVRTSNRISGGMGETWLCANPALIEAPPVEIG